MKKRRLLFGLVAFVATVYIAALVVEKYAEKKFANREIPINDDFGIIIGDIDIQILHGRLRLGKIVLPDSIEWAANTEVGSIDISGIHWLALLTQRKFRIKDVSVRDARAIIDVSKIRSDSTGQLRPSRKIELELPELDLRFDKNMHPTVRGIKARNISYSPEDGFYSFQLKAVNSHDTKKLITLDSFTMKPNYPRLEFGYKKGFRSGSVEIVVPTINLHDFKLDRLVRDSVVDARNIELIAGDVYIFTDKRLPVDTTRYVAMLHEALLEMKQKVSIDSINVKDLQLKYETINAETMNQGYVEFKHSFLVLANVTNDPVRIDESNLMSLDLFSKFMGVSDLNAHFQFHLDRADYRFFWKGSLEELEIDVADKFTVPVINVDIVNGTSKRLDFQVEADVDSAVGSLDFQYTDLRIMAVDPETRKTRKFISGMANMFFVKEHNIQGNKGYKTGKIAYAHETERGLEHYLWTSLEHGLLNTILPSGLASQIQNSTDKTLKDKGR